MIRALSFNWSVATGHKGCRWGAYVLYFPLRIATAVSFALAIVGVFPPQWLPSSVSRAPFLRGVPS